MLLQAFGHLSCKCKRHLATQGLDGMAIDLPRLQQKLWISDAYKHLGGQVTARATMSAEIAVKLAALRRTVGVLTRAIFKKKAIDR
eukprot:5835786-Prorocentrum_lima.AAC.1